MRQKLLAVLLSLMIIISTLPFAAMAEVAPPTELSAPAHFGVFHYMMDSCYFTISVAWSKASTWAEPELKKADEVGLIPNVLKDSDMTKPITREEFAELAVKLYEKVTEKTAAPASPNPFKDTSNPEILKAFKLGITTGTSATTFAPKELTNREQVATMLSRAIRVMAPDSDFSTAGAPVFLDQKDISTWALEHVKYMSRLGIIKGSDGKFMPKATTTAQQASGYATTTREQAVAMSIRSFEQFKGSPGTSIPGTSIPTPAPPEATSGPKDKSLAGVYLGLVNQWAVTGLYTPQIRFMVLFEDGTFFDDMPPEGLERFNKEKSREYYKDEDYYWGTYIWNGSSGEWKRDGQEPDEMKLDKNGNLLIRNEPYYRLKPVDGLRLDGAWTVYADPEDVKSHPGLNKPIIRFTPDGKFQDEGLFMGGDFFLPELLESFEVDEKKVAPGKGTYEINHFTLTLKYDDGRVRKTSINLYFGTDMEPSPDTIFIYRRDLQRIISP